MTTFLVTGAAGFIGFNFVRQVLSSEPDANIIALDKLTYAGNPRSLAELSTETRFRFVRGDIGDRTLIRELLRSDRPNAIVHFAAESHVDRSIDGPEDFIQ